MDLAALNEEQLMGYSPSDFLSKNLRSIMVEYGDKQYPFYYAASHQFPDYRQYEQLIVPDTMFVNSLNEDMYGSDLHLKKDSQKVKDLLTILRQQQNYDGWKPSTEIYFSHCPDDNMICYQPSRDVYEKILLQAGSNSDKIHWQYIPAERSVLAKSEQIGIHFGISVEAMLYMVLAREPKDMYTFYK